MEADVTRAQLLGGRILLGAVALWFIVGSLGRVAAGPFVAIEDVGPVGGTVAAAFGLALASIMPKRRLAITALVSLIGALILSPVALYLAIGDIPARLAGRVGGAGLGHATLYVALFLALFPPTGVTQSGERERQPAAS
jgi:hypothetical protein